MKPKPPLGVPLLAAAFGLLAASCLGMKAEILFRSDGSGIADMEYRVSKEFESLGRLSGNEGWPIIPYGREDFERTAALIEGLHLQSYSSRVDDKDFIYQARFRFKNPEALLRFLAPAGGASFSEEGGRRRLNLPLVGGGMLSSTDMGNIVSNMEEGYSFRLGFSLPKEGEILFFDGNGASRSPPGWGEFLSHSKKPFFSAPVGDLLTDSEGLSFELRW
jgi:hypothetical protein